LSKEGKDKKDADKKDKKKSKEKSKKASKKTSKTSWNQSPDQSTDKSLKNISEKKSKKETDKKKKDAEKFLDFDGFAQVTSETMAPNNSVKGKQPENLPKSPERRPYKFPAWKVKQPKVG
jgi:hypothetical protein